MALNTNIGPERVQVFDVPLGIVQVPGAGTSSAAFILSTTQVGAPLNSAVAVTDMDEFEAAFGAADECGEAYYAVKGFFDNAGTGRTAWIVNVGTTPTAASYIGDAAAGTGLRALDNIDDLGMVLVPGLPMAQAYLVQPALIDYTETIRAEFGATLSTSFSLMSIPNEISKANKNTAVKTTKFISVAGTGPYVLTVEDVVAGGTADLSAITAGMIVRNTANSFKAVVVSVNDGADEITIATDPTTSWAGGDDVFIEIASAVQWKEFVINNPSRTSAWYFNHVNVVDLSTAASPGDLVTVDPAGHAAGIIARIDGNTQIGAHSHAPAGIRFAGISGISSLQLALSERKDGEPLRLNFINRITSFPGAGNVIFGGYTADSGTSPVYTADEQLIQVMRTIQFIKASLEPGLRSFIWENYSPTTQLQVQNAIASFLRTNIHLFPAGLPETQQFKVISVTPTQDDLDKGLLKVRVQIRPNKAVRFISVDLEYPIPTA